MPLTLKAALNLLEGRGFKANIRVMKQAAKSGTLKARMVTEAPRPYYVTTEADAIEWAINRKQGNPNWRKS